MLKRIKIKIDTIEKVKDFHEQTKKYSGSELAIKQGKYTINGFSIMGIFSLNTLEPMELYYEDEYSEEAELMFGKWEVK